MTINQMPEITSLLVADGPVHIPELSSIWRTFRTPFRALCDGTPPEGDAFDETPELRPYDGRSMNCV
jgi:hypothetical protein